MRGFAIGLAIALSVTGCETSTPATMKHSCCEFLHPIYLSDDDTEATQEAILDYLIIYEAMCGE